MHVVLRLGAAQPVSAQDRQKRPACHDLRADVLSIRDLDVEAAAFLQIRDQVAQFARIRDAAAVAVVAEVIQHLGRRLAFVAVGKKARVKRDSLDGESLPEEIRAKLSHTIAADARPQFAPEDLDRDADAIIFKQHL